jgi:NosR/NirI family nitrous oxide reductase transcriptional regulator
MVLPLPVLSDADHPPPEVRPARPWRALALHALRVALFVAVVLLIHRSHQRRVLAATAEPVADPPVEVVREAYPTAERVSRDGDGVPIAVDAAGDSLGRLAQTSPFADRIIGFSGPTNVLLAFDPQGKIAAVKIISSRDTREHVAQVNDDPKFLQSYVGLTREEAAGRTRVDGVSGATLTSLAIAGSIRLVLGGDARLSRFPAEIYAPEARPLFPTAERVVPHGELPGLYRVLDASQRELGLLLRGTPATDNIVGYQGPTDVLIGLEPADDGPTPTFAPEAKALANPAPESADHGAFSDHEWRVFGVAVSRSYDNEPYVGYVREDRYFFKTFVGRTLSELAQFDLKAARVEGVSGATMTSMAVAEGLPVAAKQLLADSERIAAEKEAARFKLSPRDWGTAIVALLGVAIGLSPWRARPWVRWPWMLVLVGYLGFVNADLVSQALLVGWAKNGVPWRTMFGPLVLIVAALVTPILTRSNVYCSHLCPHGAAQQLLMRRLPWQLRLGPRWHRLLAAVPGLLLIWVVVVAITGSAFSLVDIEPFDAYVPLIAGIPALVLFAAGLFAALFVPMAYCHYGCPTGALLGWLRRHGRSDRFGVADLIACICLLLAIGLQ